MCDSKKNNDKKEGDKMAILTKKNDKMMMIDKDKSKEFMKESKKKIAKPEFLSKCQEYAAMFERDDKDGKEE